MSFKGITVVWVVLNLVLGSVVAAEVEAVFGGGERFPGDLVELKITRTEQGFSRWEIQAPRHPHLRLISEQAIPVSVNEKSEYVQAWVLVYQAIEPGEAMLSEGFLYRSVGEQEIKTAITEQAVVVSSFAEAQDHDEVEPLLIASRKSESLRDAKLIVLSFLVLVSGFSIWIVRKRKRSRYGVELDSQSDPFRYEIERILGNGDISRKEARCLVTEYSESLSDSSLNLLRTVAFSKQPDVEATLIQLKEELAR